MTQEDNGISLFFPVYNDEKTVRIVTEKALKVLSLLTNTFEIIIVNDGSPDRSGEIADQLQKEHPQVKVIHHPKNLGYGAAVKSGFTNSQYPWICFTDGDDEYDVYDFLKLYKLKDFYDLIITFRYVKLYSGKRQIISYCYNMILRCLFRINYRDVSTGLRMVRKSLIDSLDLQTDSPFIGAEIAIKTMLKGYRVGEVGIQTFPRQFGQGASTSYKNIIATIKDMIKIYKSIFSKNYELPENRLIGITNERS